MARLYSDLKIFHFGSKLKDIAKGIFSSPIHVRLKPTNRCTHKCYYCCYRTDKLYLSQCFRDNDEIPQDKMKEIITDFGRMQVKAVTLSGGGEPLYYPYFIETIKGLSAAGVKIGVLTNGSLLKGKTALVLGEEADWVRISMDAANPDTYAKTRNVSVKEFNNICTNIYNFSKNMKKRCQLGVHFIVTRVNCREIYKFLKLMKKIGVGHVKLSEAVISTKREENRREYRPILHLVRQQINKGVTDLTDNNFTIIDKFDYFKGDDSSYNKRYTHCCFSECMTVIGADMNVYACQDKAYTRSGKLGSIKNKSFREIWFSNEIKNKISKLNPHKDCLHHCTQHSKNLMLLDYLGIRKEHLGFI